MNKHKNEPRIPESDLRLLRAALENARAVIGTLCESCDDSRIIWAMDEVANFLDGKSDGFQAKPCADDAHGACADSYRAGRYVAESVALAVECVARAAGYLAEYVACVRGGVYAQSYDLDSAREKIAASAEYLGGAMKRDAIARAVRSKNPSATLHEIASAVEEAFGVNPQ